MHPKIAISKSCHFLFSILLRHLVTLLNVKPSNYAGKLAYVFHYEKCKIIFKTDYLIFRSVCVPISPKFVDSISCRFFSIETKNGAICYHTNFQMEKKQSLIAF